MKRTTMGLFSPFLSLVLCVMLPATWRMADAEMTSALTTFKAAVYGHAPILPDTMSKSYTRAEAVSVMNQNIDVYREQAKQAKQQGAEILVFPEDGIYGFIFTRDNIVPFLEFIPDPKTVSWSACDDPDRYSDTEVQQALSCIAKENSMYIVANIGDKQPCDNGQDPKCPKDGRYQYNTDVAYGPDGTLLARYHKHNLYKEYQFDQPETEIVTFDTPFGKFGMITCFDILFLEPAVTMVINNNVSNIVFPTAWMDSLPFLSALGFHTSFPRGLGVNFLSANLHLPERRFHGSGIYGPDGTKAFYYGVSSADPPKLLVAELDVVNRPQPNSPMPTKIVPNDSPVPCHNIERHGQHTSQLNPEEFSSILYRDTYTFRTLDESSGSLKVCQRDICCHLNYEIDDRHFGHDLFAFGAFDGRHNRGSPYYFQNCVLVKCADNADKLSCGKYTYNTASPFKNIEIRGEMQTQFIYPQIILLRNPNDLEVAPADSWDYKNSSLWTNSHLDNPLLVAALVGRDYRRDNCTLRVDDSSDENKSPPMISFNLATGIFWGLFSVAMMLLS